MLIDPSLFGTKRSVDHFEIFKKDGKVRLVCDVAEKWQCILDLTLKCGNKRVYRCKRTRGIALGEIESLESTIGGSLGLKGIAELSSSIRSQTRSEYRFEIAVEEEEEFEFSAPECGSVRILIFQLTRIFEIDFQDTRFLHGDAWQREIVEWLPSTRDESKQTKNDPDCGCDIKADAGIDGLMRVQLDGMRILESFNIVGDGKVHFNRLSTTVEADLGRWPYYYEMDVSAKQIPDHLLYLSFQEEEEFHARFSPVDIQLPASEEVAEPEYA